MRLCKQVRKPLAPLMTTWHFVNRTDRNLLLLASYFNVLNLRMSEVCAILFCSCCLLQPLANTWDRRVNEGNLNPPVLSQYFKKIYLNIWNWLIPKIKYNPNNNINRIQKYEIQGKRREYFDRYNAKKNYAV